MNFRYIFYFLIVIALLPGGVKTYGQCTILDQQQLNVESQFVAYVPSGQTFTAGKSGKLVEVVVKAGFNDPNYNYTFSVVLGTDYYNGPVMYSGNYVMNSPAYSEVSISIPEASAPFLTAGQEYSLRFDPQSSGGLALMEAGDYYPGGRILPIIFPGYTFDLWFKTIISVTNCISLSASSIPFGGVPINASKTDSITVTTGPDPISIDSVTSDDALFTVTPLSITIPGNSTRKFYITYSPTSNVQSSAGIRFYHNAIQPSPQVVTVSGTGVPLEPAVQASSIIFSSVTSSSVTLKWTNGNGESRIVLGSKTGPVDTIPSDGTTYIANALFGSGQQVDDSTYVIYKGAADSANVTGLIIGNTYHFAVFEFNGSVGENYLIDNPAAGQVTMTATSSTVITGSGTATNFSTAAVTGSVITQGAQTIVFFEYGTSLLPHSDTTPADTIDDPGTALLFNGAGTRVATSLTDLGGDEITIEYWFKGTNLQSAVRQDAPGAYIVAGWTNGNHILSNDGGTADGLPVGAAATDGNWHHIAMTWKRNTVNGFKSYLDGVIIGQRNSGDTPIPNSGGEVTIGSYQAGGEYTTGTIDEVRIWNAALDSSALADWRNRSITPSNPNFSHLIGYWQFNETSGTTANDGSGNGRNGALINNPVWADVQRSVSFTKNISGLDPETTYYFRIASQSSAGNSAGADSSFTTYKLAPLVQASDITFTDFTRSSMKINWTNGSGEHRLVVIKTDTGSVSSPDNLFTYAANPGFGSGIPLTPGNYIIYNGDGNSVTVTGLEAVRIYTVGIFEYNNPSGFEMYQQTPAYASHISYIPQFDSLPGTSLVFDGVDDYVSVPHDSAFDLSEFTIECWLRRTAYFFQTSEYEAIFSKKSGLPGDFGDTTDFCLYMKYYQVDQRYHLRFFSTVFGVDLETTIPFQVTDFFSNIHIAITMSSGGYLKMYYNGIQLAGFPATAGEANHNYPLIIGAAESYWGGIIDEFRIWNYVRTDEQIRNAMHIKLSGDLNGLKAYYQFNENSGTTTADSIRFNNGILNNFAYDGSFSGWLPSTVPYGPGTSVSYIPYSSGAANFGRMTLQNQDFTTSPIFAVTGTVIYSPPNILPQGYSEIAGNCYFVLNDFDESNISGSHLWQGTLKFVLGPGVVMPAGEADPNTIKIFTRSIGSDGDWNNPIGAFSADAATGTIEFFGSYPFGQYAIAGNVGGTLLLPVELSSFTGTSTFLNAVLKWQTATETDNYGFDVERKVYSQQPANGSQPQWEKAGFVKGNGNSNSPKEYVYTDNQLPAGKYLYRLKQIDNDGTFRYSEEIEVEVGAAPLEFNLSQNYPNPFNPETMINFTVAENGLTTLKIFNILGEEQAALFNEMAEAGKYQQVKFDASNLPSGIYFARLQSGNHQMIKKMMLLK